MSSPKPDFWITIPISSKRLWWGRLSRMFLRMLLSPKLVKDCLCTLRAVTKMKMRQTYLPFWTKFDFESICNSAASGEGLRIFALIPPLCQLCMKIHKLCLFDSQVPFSTKLPSNMAINIQFSWSFHFCFVIQISFRLICSFISMHKMPWIPQHCKYLPSFSPAGRAQGLHCPAQCTAWDFMNS